MKYRKHQKFNNFLLLHDVYRFVLINTDRKQNTLISTLKVQYLNFGHNSDFKSYGIIG